MPTNDNSKRQSRTSRARRREVEELSVAYLSDTDVCAIIRAHFERAAPAAIVRGIRYTLDGGVAIDHVMAAG